MVLSPPGTEFCVLSEVMIQLYFFPHKQSIVPTVLYFFTSSANFLYHFFHKTNFLMWVCLCLSIFWCVLACFTVLDPIQHFSKTIFVAVNLCVKKGDTLFFIFLQNTIGFSCTLLLESAFNVIETFDCNNITLQH